MIADVFRQDLLVMIADAPQEFTHNGETYVGTISGLSERKPLEIGGFQEEPELTLLISIRGPDGELTMPTLPAVNDRIIIGTVTYRVDRREIDQFNVGFQMDLRSVHK